MDYISKPENKNKIVRRCIFAVFIIVTFIFQNTGGLFPAPNGIHAILLLPLTICIAMFEREFAGMFFGLLAGALLDAFSTDTLCYHSLMFTAIGFFTGALITYLMRNNLVCATILTAVLTFIYNTVYYFLYCASDGNPKPVSLYFKYFFVSIIYTVIFTPLYYFIVREISKKMK